MRLIVNPSGVNNLSNLKRPLEKMRSEGSKFAEGKLMGKEEASFVAPRPRRGTGGKEVSWP